MSIRVAVVGAGYAGALHASRLTQCSDVTVAAVCDIDAGRAAALAGAANASDVVTRLEEVADVDCVYICTPPHAHVDAVRVALSRGINVLIEKPIAPDLTAAEELAAEVAGSGLIVTVGYQWRYRGDLDLVRSLVQQHEPIAVEMRWVETAPSSSWWVTRDLSGGQVVEQLTHLLDLSRYLFGEVEAVHAMSHIGRLSEVTAADTTVGCLAFSSGLLATVLATAASESREGPSLGITTRAGRLVLTQSGLRWHGPVPSEWPLTDDPYLAQARAFTRAVVTGDHGDLRIDYSDALRTHALAWRIRLAADAALDAAGVEHV